MQMIQVWIFVDLSIYGLFISDDYPLGTSFNNCLRTTIVILSVDPFFPIHPDSLWVDVTEWLNIYNNMHFMNWLICIARILDEFQVELMQISMQTPT